MNRATEVLPVGTIIVGDRLREDFGDINALAESIQSWGLIHPLTVDADNNLIAGERRLRAMKQLGFLEVEVRRWEELSESQRRELELEENLRRKDLTAYEQSKNLVELAKTAKEVDKEEAEREANHRSVTSLADSAKEVKPAHRPKGSEVPGSMRRVAERIGVPRETIRDAVKHVVLAETYPALQKPGWKQYHAMQAAEVLSSMPEEDRTPIAELIDQPYIPPHEAISMLRNVAEKNPVERKEIIGLAQSLDSRDRTLAITLAADLPPMPDERIALLGNAERMIGKAVRLHPEDSEVPSLKEISDRIKSVISELEGKTKNAHAQHAAA